MYNFSRICFKNVYWVQFHLPGARDTVLNKRNKISALMELICLCKTHPFLFRRAGGGNLPLAKQFICNVLFSLQFFGGNFQIFRKVERIILWILRYSCLNSSIVYIILSLFFSICIYIYTYIYTSNLFPNHLKVNYRYHDTIPQYFSILFPKNMDLLLITMTPSHHHHIKEI